MDPDSIEKTISRANKPATHGREVLVFQLLLFCSILFSIFAGVFVGALASIIAATVFCLAALAYHNSRLGFDARALFACVIFYLLALFFISARFLAPLLSFSLVPFAALLFAALIMAFRFLVYNKRAQGVVVGRHGRFTIVQVHSSPWHSLSGTQVFEGNASYAEGTKVKISIKSGVFSPPRISSISPLH